MIIVHPIDNFIYELFPNIEKNIESLEKAFRQFYTVENVEPQIEFSSDFVKITIDTERVEIESKKFQKLISLCESSKFEEAKVLAVNLIDSNPNISEYHRILGQIYSELGNQEEAVNSLIYSLRWNPKNEWALLMMGNIYAKFKNDIDTAMKYYDQVLIVKPNDAITLNNIGANLMQLGQKEEALNYFRKALESDSNYPNTYYAIALIADMEGNYKKAFEYSLQAIAKTNKQTNKQIYANSFHLAIESANKLKSEIDAKRIIDDFIAKLSYVTEKEIRIEEDNSIPTAAKIEFAENYNREYHFVKYKSNYTGVEHLILHELTHLELAEEARKNDANELFISNQSNKSSFFYSIEKEALKLKKKGISEENISNYFSALFDGLNSQIYNTPIDLFIEDRIFNQWETIRPIQFLSLLTLLQEGIEATTKKEIVQNSPKRILSKSKIFNLINALHFKTLFKVDLVSEHKPSKIELDQAEELYNEFLEYRVDKEPGEEYELVLHWAEDLKLDGYFELVPESKHKQKSIESVLEEIENDPFGLEATNSSQERKMKKFLKEHSSKETNMAVVMYMVDAINYFSKLQTAKIKEIAFEIATLGTAGIDPNKKNYSIPSIKGSNFSGYKMLAYYYVSWAISIPEMVKSLQLPFDKEYELALNFTKL
jgi:tetratricopeptide (TPR) repeat protein